LAVPASSDLRYEQNLYRNTEELNFPKTCAKECPICLGHGLFSDASSANALTLFLVGIRLSFRFPLSFDVYSPHHSEEKQGVRRHGECGIAIKKRWQRACNKGDIQKR